MKKKPTTNLYLDKDEQLCVDINEIIYNILNPIYKFNDCIIINNEIDLNKTFNKAQINKKLFLDISNSNNVVRDFTRLSLEVFINPTLTIVTVIHVNLLEIVRTLNLKVEVEYVPKTLMLDDCEIELEEKLAILIFDNRGDEEYEY